MAEAGRQACLQAEGRQGADAYHIIITDMAQRVCSLQESKVLQVQARNTKQKQGGNPEREEGEEIGERSVTEEGEKHDLPLFVLNPPGREELSRNVVAGRPLAYQGGGSPPCRLPPPSQFRSSVCLIES